MTSALPLTTDIDKALARRAADRDADQKQWACFKVSPFHSATILVLVVSPCPTCKRWIVLIAVFEDMSGYQSAIRMRVACKVVLGT
jgi:hypothetical protein